MQVLHILLYLLGKQDFALRILEEFDDCERMILGDQGAIKLQCMKEIAGGLTRNQIRRKYCVNDEFRNHLEECIQYKVRTKPHYLVSG